MLWLSGYAGSLAIHGSTLFCRSKSLTLFNLNALKNIFNLISGIVSVY